jgi:hypothetical protein
MFFVRAGSHCRVDRRTANHDSRERLNSRGNHELPICADNPKSEAPIAGSCKSRTAIGVALMIISHIREVNEKVTSGLINLRMEIK